jgi:hypothetical protein
MKLTLHRRYAIGEATIGALSVDGVFQCFTLEDRVRAVKIKNITAIPPGDYGIALTESPRLSDDYERRGLGRMVPLLEGVSGFEGVRIHVGNRDADTEGCILVGDWSPGAGAVIGGSVIAFKALMAKLMTARSPIRLVVTEALETLAADARPPSAAQVAAMKQA